MEAVCCCGNGPKRLVIAEEAKNFLIEFFKMTADGTNKNLYF